MTYITTPCLCGETAASETRKAVSPYFDAELVPGFTVKAAALSTYQRCEKCGTWRQSPRLDDESIGRYYSEGIYRATLGITEEVIDRDELHRAKIDAKLVGDYIGQVDSHLDIGCSRGYFLREVKAHTRAGVEPNADWTRESVGVVGSLSEIDRTYELVSMIHVLEHEPYPVEYLKRAASKMNQGGLMIVEVPSWNSPGGPLRLAHLWHWEPDAMRETLELAGLRIVKALTTPHLFVIAERER